jgi:hypothetical protein
MVMLTLPNESVKTLMNKLLVRETFDGFELRGCTIQSFARFDIEGITPPPVKDDPQNASSPPPKTEYCRWRRLRPYVYSIIKGNERPRFFKIVFACPKDILEAQFTEAGALFANITLDRDTAHITTGASAKIWSLDKSTEELWDGYMMKFLQQNQIYFDQ